MAELQELIVEWKNDNGLTADMVIRELVRCKDCKHCGEEYGWNAKPYKYCALHHQFMTADWFCADGERNMQK